MPKLCLYVLKYISSCNYHNEYLITNILLLGKYSDLSGPTGQIYSPLYPKSYLTYETFSYKITVALKKKIVLSFKEFDLVSEEGSEMDCDYVYIEVRLLYVSRQRHIPSSAREYNSLPFLRIIFS